MNKKHLEVTGISTSEEDLFTPDFLTTMNKIEAAVDEKTGLTLELIEVKAILNNVDFLVECLYNNNVVLNSLVEEGLLKFKESDRTLQ